MIDKGAAVDAVIISKQTTLMMAAGRGHMDAMKLLLKHGADPDYKTRDSETTLDIARKRNQSRAVQFLENL